MRLSGSPPALNIFWTKNQSSSVSRSVIIEATKPFQFQALSTFKPFSHVHILTLDKLTFAHLRLESTRALAHLTTEI
jgi:hypothetical protein